ncbi:MAG: YraN family protein [Nitrospinae bacterium]|nr:YraN family protein [Nitrospinota bacterium]
MLKNKREIGKEGEEVAADYLRKKGYTIITTNYQKQCGEIDIIAEINKTIVFIEVKYRKQNALVSAEESITHIKKQRLIKTARHYIREEGNKLGNKGFRFDVIALSGLGENQTLQHYENAFIVT